MTFAAYTKPFLFLPGLRPPPSTAAISSQAPTAVTHPVPSRYAGSHSSALPL